MHIYIYIIYIKLHIYIYMSPVCVSVHIIHIETRRSIDTHDFPRPQAGITTSGISPDQRGGFRKHWDLTSAKNWYLIIF